ncbi:prolipoprotein diacylglyceryl transferase [Verticiella sediminum]|uniref:Phosphatidylglycerol--prolipoprotein diacylglyceryl transferase n=1 Tax=Verticiella sediminum TaxID=1247510 RepID=A0A556AMY4_9BURK|nr:prolipoprotein diacylglyceryl transferase [Verticiella sediminum]TSH94237.1 prolipoprotein diacylglyceryl transferase [Verticiella sediminum]
MLQHPQFDPIALQIGPLAVHWYGLMYLVGFALAWLLGRRLIARGVTRLTPRDFEDLLFYAIVGVIVGGRLGYVLFYKPAYYLAHPLEIFAVWEGGMAFHGGLLGVLAVILWFSRRRGFRFLEIGDFVAPLVPLGLAAGRMGNFINGELWGRVTDAPWAMVFPAAQDGLPRHPSQLYQFALEGVLLFVIVWLVARRPQPVGRVSAVFLIGYGAFRFLAEFTREPDSFLGLLAGGLSMGQWLSIPMVIAGILIYRWSAGQPRPAPSP